MDKQDNAAGAGSEAKRLIALLMAISAVSKRMAGKIALLEKRRAGKEKAQHG